MPDHWGWVEEEPGVLKPVVGYGIGRTQFPPDPPHPAVGFTKYDPDVPAYPAAGPNVSVGPFGDFDVFAGWNGDMSLAGAILDSDTTSAGVLNSLQFGQTPRLSVIDTSDPLITNWNLRAGHFDMTGITSVQDARFIPFTNVIAFTAVEASTRKLMAVDTDTMTRVLNVSKIDLTGGAGDVILYAYSFDGSKLAITFNGTQGTRVYNRSGIGPGTELSSGSNIFGTLYPTLGVCFTDDGNFIFVWGLPNAGHAIYRSFPPYVLIDIMPGNIYGTTQAFVDSVTYHHANTYFQRSSNISLGFAGNQPFTQFFNDDLVFQFDAGGSNGSGPLRGDWSGGGLQGDVWIGTDGGRDPNGGIIKVVKTGSWAVGSSTPQEYHTIRLRPYH